MDNMGGIEVPEALPPIKYIDISNEEYQKIQDMFKYQPERSKREDFFGSIFDTIPCYGSHGDINTLEGKMNRELCPDCQKRCGALNTMET